uniref:Uncharacterized protein n=1 Tax=Oryza barthii TaxID=65489 RepID=A0A0D3H9X8_9ORYZ
MSHHHRHHLRRFMTLTVFHISRGRLPIDLNNVFFLSITRSRIFSENDMISTLHIFCRVTGFAEDIINCEPDLEPKLIVVSLLTASGLRLAEKEFPQLSSAFTNAAVNNLFPEEIEIMISERESKEKIHVESQEAKYEPGLLCSEQERKFWSTSPGSDIARLWAKVHMTSDGGPQNNGINIITLPVGVKSLGDLEFSVVEIRDLKHIAVPFLPNLNEIGRPTRQKNIAVPVAHLQLLDMLLLEYRFLTLAWRK